LVIQRHPVYKHQRRVAVLVSVNITVIETKNQLTNTARCPPGPWPVRQNISDVTTSKYFGIYFFDKKVKRPA